MNIERIQCPHCQRWHLTPASKFDAGDIQDKLGCSLALAENIRKRAHTDGRERDRREAIAIQKKLLAARRALR
jgi:hypothetical protein